METYYQRNRKSLLKRYKEQYQENPEEFKKKAREFYKKNRVRVLAELRIKRDNPHYRKKQAARYGEWYENNGRKRSKASREMVKIWCQLHPEKTKAMRLLHKALQKGQIIKPLACSLCNKKTRLHGHHSDYSKPLKVVWCCSSCHKKIHLKFDFCKKVV